MKRKAGLVAGFFLCVVRIDSQIDQPLARSVERAINYAQRSRSHQPRCPAIVTQGENRSRQDIIDNRK